MKILTSMRAGCIGTHTQGPGLRALRDFDERIVIRQTLVVYGDLLEERGGPALEWVDIWGQIDAQPLPVGRE